MIPKSHTIAATIRTIVQVVASAGFLAAVNLVVDRSGYLINANGKAAILAALVPVVAIAHNALEDHGWIGTWLRQPTLTAATLQKQADKATAAARAESDRLAAEAAAVAPPAVPLIDVVKGLLDQYMAKVDSKVDHLAAQLATTGGPAPAEAPGMGQPPQSEPQPVDAAGNPILAPFAQPPAAGPIAPPAAPVV